MPSCHVRLTNLLTFYRKVSDATVIRMLTKKCVWTSLRCRSNINVALSIHLNIYVYNYSYTHQLIYLTFRQCWLVSATHPMFSMALSTMPSSIWLAARLSLLRSSTDGSAAAMAATITTILTVFIMAEVKPDKTYTYKYKFV